MLCSVTLCSHYKIFKYLSNATHPSLLHSKTSQVDSKGVCLHPAAHVHTDRHGRRHLRSSSYRTLAVPRTRTTLGDRSFAVTGPRVWNILLATIRRITSYGQFRQHPENTFIQGLEIAMHCDS